MRLLFVQGGSRVKIDSKGNFYVDGNFNSEVLSDYASLCNETYFLLRVDKCKYSDDILKQKFNLINNFNLVLLDDVYESIYKRFNKGMINRNKRIIEEQVKLADKVIIRSIGNFYTNTVLKYCKKFKKEYLIEVTGFAFEGLWYHSLKGKVLAVPREIKQKKALRDAPYAVYVTKEALQKRYPCNGKTLGCSDVRINQALTIDSVKPFCDKDISLSTIAFYDVKWKGQRDVIKALYILKQKYGIEMKYYLVGSGNGNNLKQVVKKYKMENQVFFVGALEHSKVFTFLDSIDIYIQPSYQEGLCRAIVEAMSRGKIVVCSNVGGNYELIDSKYIYPKKKSKSLAQVLVKISNEKTTIKDIQQRNLDKSLDYKQETLQDIRRKFYCEFMED